MELHRQYLPPRYASACAGAQDKVMRQIKGDAIMFTARLCREEPSLSYRICHARMLREYPIDKRDAAEIWCRGIEQAFYQCFWGRDLRTARKLYLKWIIAEPANLFRRHVLSLAPRLIR